MLATQLNQTVHTFQSKDGIPIQLRPVRIEDANEIALKLYQRAGFIIEGVQKNQVIFNTQFADDIWMAYFFKEEGEIR